MKDIPRFAATLTLVALVASGSLAWLNEITHPRILAQQEEELKAGLISVLPEVDGNNILPVVEGDEILYYEGYRDKDRSDLIGYAFLCLSQGYSSTIRTLVGIDTSGTILAIRVLSQKETPGLGTRVQEVRQGETRPWWQVQFNGRVAVQVTVDKDGGEITSITGATITSRAITDEISLRAAEILQAIQSHENEL